LIRFVEKLEGKPLVVDAGQQLDKAIAYALLLFVINAGEQLEISHVHLAVQQGLDYIFFFLYAWQVNLPRAGVFRAAIGLGESGWLNRVFCQALAETILPYVSTVLVLILREAEQHRLLIVVKAQGKPFPMGEPVKQGESTVLLVEPCFPRHLAPFPVKSERALRGHICV